MPSGMENDRGRARVLTAAARVLRRVNAAALLDASQQRQVVEAYGIGASVQSIRRTLGFSGRSILRALIGADIDRREEGATDRLTSLASTGVVCQRRLCDRPLNLPSQVEGSFYSPLTRSGVNGTRSGRWRRHGEVQH
jgi:hypothetical protein